jgi:bifunctional oligoribonuclease and PAP phosphatase NrnA
VTSRMTDSLTTDLVARIRETLEKCHHPLVLSHIDPDGDALGTQLAVGAYLESLGKPVVMLRDSDIPNKYAFLPGIERIVRPNGPGQSGPFDVAIVLECPQLQRLGAAARFIGPQTLVINIDHHPDNELEAEISWLDVKASSVGEMMYEYFSATGVELDHSMATQLYTAILTDTGRFRFGSTTPRTLAIAGELVRAGADPREICDRVYFDMDPAVVKLTGRVLSALEYHDHGRICIMPLTQQMLVDTGASVTNTEGLVDYSLFTRGVEAGALFRELETGFTKVSLRSRNGINVAAIAARYGGGGHPNAAGCLVKLPLEQAKQEIVSLLQESHEA